MQNGVDNALIINEYLHNNIILLAAIKVGLSINHKGIVIHTFGGEIKLGYYKKCLNKGDISHVLDVFEKAGIKCEFVNDIHKRIWEKALWNAAYNPLSAVLEKSCGQLIKDKKVVCLMDVLMEEVVDAAKCDSIYIDENTKKSIFQLDDSMEAFKTSMLQDIEALRKPEIDGILLPIIKRLEQKGNINSYHRLLYNIIDAKYGRPFIYTPKIAADTIIVNRSKEVLLIKRKNPPFGWAIPGGFIDYNEKAEDAAKREIFEETGLLLDDVNLFGVYSDPDRDVRGHTISVVYYSNTNREPKAGDDAADACFFSFQNLPELAFDHYSILNDFSKKFFNLSKENEF